MSIGNISGPRGVSGGSGGNSEVEQLARLILNEQATDEVKERVDKLDDNKKFQLGTLLAAQAAKIKRLIETGQHPNIALIMSMIAPLHARIKTIMDELED